jgi:C-terminal processing protease CtpA/Prc
MGFVSHVDAIIYDMRENGGGDPKMVAFACTYLFDKPTHVNDLYNRKEDKTTQYWTLPYVPGIRLPDKAAFVLTSARTFSGAEEFTNDLKTQKRATIVGETTGGGAHPVGGHRIDDHFTIGVPFARAINPITKTDWEGTGVAPDVSVKASDALETAEKLAAEKIESNRKAEAAKTKVEMKEIPANLPLPRPKPE